MSARFIWFAAELRPLRITSVVTGSASATPAPSPLPARYTTASACIDHQAAGRVDASRVAGVEVGGRGLLEDDRGPCELVARSKGGALHDGERHRLAASERMRVERDRCSPVRLRREARLAATRQRRPP